MILKLFVFITYNFLIIAIFLPPQIAIQILVIYSTVILFPAQALVNVVVKIYNWVNTIISIGGSLKEINFATDLQSQISTWVLANNMYYVLGFPSIPIGVFLLILANYLFFSLGTQIVS